MPFKLRILFSGLIMFVPGEFNEDRTEVPAMCALLIDGRAPGKTVDGNHNHVSHTPCVRFNMDNVKPKNSSKVDYLFYKEDSQPMGMWVLRGDDLEIRGISAGKIQLAQTPLVQAFWQLATMSSLHDAKPIYVKSDCLTTTQLEKHNLVARLKLINGEVGTVVPSATSVSNDNAGTTDNAENVIRDETAELYYETTIESEVVIASKKPQGPQVTLYGKEGETVVVRIENMALTEIVPDPNNFQFDFELLYRVLDDRLEKRIPDNNNGGGGAGNSMCSLRIADTSTVIF